MSQKYLEPTKKFISRKAAISKLRITPKQFDELAVLCGVFPVLANEKNALHPELGWYYKILDIKKIYYSEAYDVLRKNKQNDKRRERYKRHNFEEKYRNCLDEEYALVDLVKNKYPSFAESVSDLGTSLRNLYLMKMLGISSANPKAYPESPSTHSVRIGDTNSHQSENTSEKSGENVPKEEFDDKAAPSADSESKITKLCSKKYVPCIESTLAEFEDFVLSRRMLDCAFLSKRSVFLSFVCEGIRVVWSIPYHPATDFSDKIEVKTDVITRPDTSKVKLPDFPDDYDSDEQDQELEIDPNDPNKLDVSLLKFSAPLLEMHVKLVLHKLSLLIPQTPSQRTRTGIFKGKKMCVSVRSSVGKWIEFVAKNEDAELVNDLEAEIIIAEVVETVLFSKVYVQPQYVFDSLNAREALKTECYGIGKELPPHKSPFPDALSLLDERTLKTLSNTKRYKIQDKIEELY